jgi:hypothetical protein
VIPGILHASGLKSRILLIATAMCYLSPMKKALNCQEFKPRKTIKGIFLFQGKALGIKLFCLRFVKLLVHELDCEFDWQPLYGISAENPFYRSMPTCVHGIIVDKAGNQKHPVLVQLHHRINSGLKYHHSPRLFQRKLSPYIITSTRQCSICAA